MKKIALITLGAGFLPWIAFAQVSDVNTLLDLVRNIVNALLPIIIAFAVLFFFYGLVKYVLSANDEGARSEARSIMIWGIIIIFVMVSVFGLVNILIRTFDLDNTSIDAEIPNVPAARTI